MERPRAIGAPGASVDAAAGREIEKGDNHDEGDDHPKRRHVGFLFRPAAYRGKPRARQIRRRAGSRRMAAGALVDAAPPARRRGPCLIRPAQFSSKRGVRINDPAMNET
jgi:hypothetical protein